MKTTIHCDERITNIRNSIYVKLFWGIIILDTLAYLLDYFFQTSLNGLSCICKVTECEQYHQRDCRGWIQAIQRQLQTTGR